MEQYHLPTLLNPLLNSIFNCPNPSNSPLKKLYASLKDKSFILLVPPTETLLNYTDTKTKIQLEDLCYHNVDFIGAHILLPPKDSISSSSSTIDDGYTRLASIEQFDTLNGDNILVKWRNNFLVLLSGSPNRQKIKIERIQVLPNFNDYLQGSTYFILVHIDKPLMKDVIRLNDELECFDTLTLHDNDGDSSPDARPLIQDMSQHERSQFENIINTNDTWNKRFKDWMNEYKDSTTAEEPNETLFKQIVAVAYNELKSNKIFKGFGHLRRLIHEYLEINLYDHLWLQITTLCALDDETKGTRIKNISIEEIDDKFYEMFPLDFITKLEKNMVRSTNSINKLKGKNSFNEKSENLIATLQILTNMDNPIGCLLYTSRCV